MHKRKLIKLIKRLIFPPKAAKKTANSFVMSFYREHGGRGKSYPRNYWCKNKYWDFFFYSLPHVEPSVKFVPRDYHAIVLESALENSRYGDLATEKNYYDKVFAGQGVKIPQTYFKLIDGVLLDRNFRRISESDIYKACGNRDIVVKQTLTSSGLGVRKWEIANDSFFDGSEKYSLSDIAKIMGSNLIGQELIHQHTLLDAVNPTTLNTLRLFTYRSVVDNAVHVTLAMLRMGTGSTFVDNVSAGGIAVGIALDSGKMMQYAFDKSGNFYERHPVTEFVFQGVEIPEFWKIVETTKQLADVLSHNRLIGWDLAISREGETVLIEPNIGVGTWMMQVASGTPTFGEFSDEVRDYIQRRIKDGNY